MISAHMHATHLVIVRDVCEESIENIDEHPIADIFGARLILGGILEHILLVIWCITENCRITVNITLKTIVKKSYLE